MSTFTYSAKDVSIIFGFIQLSGYAPDSFVTIEYNNDAWKLAVGASGEATRSQSNDMSAKITVRIQPGALSNTLLTGFFQADRFTRKGALPMIVTDLGTGTTHTGTAWIVKLPKKEYAMESQVLEWVFESGSMEAVYGTQAGF